MILQALIVQSASDVMIGEFLRTKAQGSALTAKAYQEDVSRFVRFVDKPLEQVRLSDLLAFRESLSALSPRTQARILSAVRSLFRWANDLGYLRLNPALAVRLPKVSKQTDRFLTDGELWSVFEALRGNPRDYLVGSLLLLTAGRVSEIAGIRWCDFYEDREGNIGLVLHGKGDKERRLAVVPALWEQIVAYRLSLGRGIAFDPDDHSPLLMGQRGPLTPNGIWRIIHNAASRAGIAKKPSPHWFRHTALTKALEGGAQLQQVQELAGHSDLRTTSRYIHAKDQLRDSATHAIRFPM